MIKTIKSNLAIESSSEDHLLECKALVVKLLMDETSLVAGISF